MSTLTRIAQTDEQETALRLVERAFKMIGKNPAGFTTIGKEPQTALVDIRHHDGKIRVSSTGEIEIDGVKINKEITVLGISTTIRDIITPPIMPE